MNNRHHSDDRNQNPRGVNNGQSQTIDKICAPYNFVPLSEYVFLPDWHEKVSQDIPLRDGYCGTIDFTITAHTPILPGKKNGGTIEHFKLPDGHLAIPGSTLRGMVRAVLEIASFGKMRMVDDVRYGLRDLTSGAKKIYGDRFTINHSRKYDLFSQQGPFESRSKSGWLLFDYSKNVWKIIPCEYARVDKADLKLFLRKNDCWDRLLKGEINENGRYVPDAKRVLPDAVVKYKWWKDQDHNLNLSFNVGDLESRKHSEVKIKDVDYRPKYLIYRKATDLGNGVTDGWLVFTGQPGPEKHMEFIFYADSEETIEIENSVMRKFLHLYDLGKGKNEKQNNQSHYQYLKKLDFGGKGIPVFYLEESNNLKAIGLSQLFKLPYENSVGDLIDKCNDTHRADNAFDLAELLFGTIYNKGEQSLKGRVDFSHARSTKLADEYKVIHKTTVLGSPKPTYYPNYIIQNEDKGKLNTAQYNTYMNDDAQIRGWKRYPVRENFDITKPEEGQGENVQSCIKPVEKGVVYKGKLRFHNLQKKELGALLWAMTWGGNENCRHAIGMGKSFGLGQISIHVSSKDMSGVKPNSPSSNKPDFNELIDAFEKMMTQKIVNWGKTDQIKQLLAVANSAEAEGKKLEHMNLNKGGKNNQFTLAKGARKHTKLVLEKYKDSGEEIIICVSEDKKWLNETVEKLSKNNGNAAEQTIKLGKLLAEAWQQIENVSLRDDVLQLIKKYWEENGGWDSVQHKSRSRKLAYQIYTRNNMDKNNL